MEYSKIDVEYNNMSLSNKCNVCFNIDIIVIIYSLFFLSVGDWDVGISLLMQKRREGVGRMSLR